MSLVIFIQVDIFYLDFESGMVSLRGLPTIEAEQLNLIFQFILENRTI